MGQPTQIATNYTARSNIDTAQIFLHANGQSAPRSGSARDIGRGAGSHTPSTASESFSHLRVVAKCIILYEHGNDSLFYTAVEKDSLIAFLWHILACLSFGCL